MPRWHLSREVLGRLLLEPADGTRAVRPLLHLAGCEHCRQVLVEEFGEGGERFLAEWAPFEPDGRSLEELARERAPSGSWWPSEIQELEESVGAGGRRLLRELEEAPALWTEVSGLPREEQRRALEARRFHRLGLALHLSLLAREEWHSSPRQAQHLAALALGVANRVDTVDYPAGVPGDVRARAQAYVGNALRLRGDLRAAEKSLERALETLEAGSGYPSCRAEILWFQGELFRGQRRFADALEVAGQAESFYREAGDRRMTFWLEAHQSLLKAEAGELETAITELEGLLSTAKPEIVGLDFVWLTRQNLCHRLVVAGRRWDARRLLRDLRRSPFQQGKPLMEARVTWLEALLLGGEGEHRKARERLERVRDLFLQRGLPYDAALACLDLGIVYLQEGRSTAAAKLASILEPVFRSQGIHREALASLRLFIGALQEKAATADSARKLQELLRRGQRRRDI